MPIFRLTPVVAELRNPAWGESPVREDCWVNANDEAEARGMASARFQDARATIPGQPNAASPWRNASLVTAEAEAETPANMTIPYGTVVSASQS